MYGIDACHKRVVVSWDNVEFELFRHGQFSGVTNRQVTPDGSYLSPGMPRGSELLPVL